MQRSRLAVAAFFLMVLSALAQEGTPEGECPNRFKASDLNGDGVLTPTEIPKAAQLPPPLGKEALIGRKQYMAECAKLPFAQASQASDSKEQTASPETKGQQQPQGPTGPIETKSGGAPPESPQGQTPPGMQPAPQGSDKSTVEPDAKK